MGRAFVPPTSRKQQQATKPKPSTRCPLPLGKHYGFLRVLRRAKKPKAWGLAVMCRCDCGADLAVRCADLERGAVRSCGKGKHYRPFEDRAPSEECLAARATTERAEGERIAALYPDGRLPKPLRESDLLIWRKGAWMS